MRPALKVLAHLLFVFALVMFFALSGGAYDWMQEMDRAAQIPSDTDGDSTVFTLLLLLLVVAAQAVLMFIAKNNKERRLPALLVAIAVLVWGYCFV